MPNGSRLLSVIVDVQLLSPIADLNSDNLLSFEPAVIFGVSVVLCLAVYFIFRDKCPDCKRIRALEFTGSHRNAVWVPDRFGSGGHFETEHELQCKYCGHSEWRRDRSD